jgi:hypothetical protein
MHDYRRPALRSLPLPWLKYLHSSHSSNGQSVEQAPFGFDVVNVWLVVNEAETAVLNRIRPIEQTDSASILSVLANSPTPLSRCRFDTLVKALNVESIPAKRGGTWHAMSVRQVLATASL